MNLLLDTHVALWWATTPAALDAQARAAIEASDNAIFVSAASAWELSIKVRSGKLAVDIADLFNGLTRTGVRILGVGVRDGILAGALAWLHRDPFDRMLVAQAQVGELSLVTRDTAILNFDAVVSIRA